MSLLSNYFTEISGGVKSTESSNPADLPRIHNRADHNTYAKFATNNWHNADSAAYWDMLANSSDVVSISQDNVYETVTDYTGSGYFFGLVSPSSNIAGAEVHIKITIDGTATILPSQLISPSTPYADIETSPIASALNNRIHLGYFGNIGQTSNDQGGGNGPQSYYDQGFKNYTGSILGIKQDKYGVPGATAHISTITPADYLRFNLNRIRFENSLKVEVKMINGNFTGFYNKTCSFWLKDAQTL